ncbi:MAG: XRE family transcriptional regulator [Myxococcales bacterium]|nr:XRE family transcriptional regulator [Myxococcales bacterium]
MPKMSNKVESQSNPLVAFGPTVQRLRKAAGLSLNELSGESGIAKSILSRIENNETNPTLNTIWRLSQALNTNIDELLKNLNTRPALIAHHTSAQLPTLTSEDGLCELRIIGAIDTVEWAQVYELTALPGGILDSAPHPQGTVESLFVRAGKARVEVNGDRWEAIPGEVLRYRGDLSHRITSIGDIPLSANMTTLRQ